jgi:formate dehydrogenase major subunit
LKALTFGTGASMLSGCLPKDLKYKKDIQIIENKYKLIAKLKCPFCNAGCLLNVRSEDSKIKSIGKISPVVQPKSTSGMICLKGMVIPETLFTKRLKKPLIEKTVLEKYHSWKSSGDSLSNDYNNVPSDKQKLRDETLGYNSDKEIKREFIEISTNEAIEIIGDKTIYTLQKLTSDEIYSYSSTSLPIEAHYSINKFMRGLLSSPNLDTDIRLGGLSSILAMKDSIGSYLSNNRIEELLSADLVFISGANIRSSMPVYFWKYLDAIRKQQKTTIIVDPRKTSTVREIENILLSDKSAKKKTYGYSSVVGSVDETNTGNLYHLSAINSDIAIVNAITNKILTKYQNAIDTNFINNFTEGYEAFSKNIIDNYTFKKIENIIGVSEELIDKIAQEIATTSINAKQRNEGGVLWLVGQGVSQNLYGYEAVKSIINLLAITGNLSRKGAGLIPVVGQNNAMGCFISGNVGETLIGGISTEEALTDYRFSKWSFTIGYNNIPITEVISSMWGIDVSSLKDVISKKPKMFAKSFTKGENKAGSTAYIIGSALKMIPSYNLY